MFTQIEFEPATPHREWILMSPSDRKVQTWVNKFDLRSVHIFSISNSNMFDKMTLSAIFEYLFDNVLSIESIWFCCWEKKESLFYCYCIIKCILRATNFLSAPISRRMWNTKNNVSDILTYSFIWFFSQAWWMQGTNSLIFFHPLPFNLPRTLKIQSCGSSFFHEH